ncbi:Rrf2 family transcriptional regulator [Paenibacillus sp. TRM 82003]|nr:Rrf2 family transcriptional regulator [Paenibacillus sp. TRM 82003]
MQYSKSAGYALHALVHLARAEKGMNVGIKELSAALGVSESYLSKIMSKLRQDGIVRAAPGANGGYELARTPDRITFLDAVQVVEGRQPLYECFHGETPWGKECLIRQTMNGAEERMNGYLAEHTIQWVLDEAARRERT